MVIVLSHHVPPLPLILFLSFGCATAQSLFHLSRGKIKGGVSFRKWQSVELRPFRVTIARSFLQARICCSVDLHMVTVSLKAVKVHGGSCNSLSKGGSSINRIHIESSRQIPSKTSKHIVEVLVFVICL